MGPRAGLEAAKKRKSTAPPAGYFVASHRINTHPYINPNNVQSNKRQKHSPAIVQLPFVTHCINVQTSNGVLRLGSKQYPCLATGSGDSPSQQSTLIHIT
jgi:hypothetical protein